MLDDCAHPAIRLLPQFMSQLFLWYHILSSGLHPPGIVSCTANSSCHLPSGVPWEDPERSRVDRLQFTSQEKQVARWGGRTRLDDLRNQHTSAI